MLILSLDFECTGLDFVKDHVIEVGAILWSSGQKRALESQGFLVKSEVPVTSEITKITGITQTAIDKYGYNSDESLSVVLDLMTEAEAVIGHNVVRFDKRMLQAWADREGVPVPERLWIDTFTDLPETFATKLGYMAADKGFLNLFAHGALTDCLTVLKLIEGYNFDEIVTRAKSPTVILRSHQARNENDLVKQEPFRFRWNSDRKWWWKAVKMQDVDKIISLAPFDISIEKEVLLSDLEK